MENLTTNVHYNLLFLLKKNWHWIFFLHQKLLTAPCPIPINCISDLSCPIGITGSNFNNSCKITVQVDNPACCYFFNEIKPLMIISINEFFKSKIVNEIYIISKHTK